MRPSSIIWFERLYLLSLILGTLHGIFFFDETVAQIESDPGMGALGMGAGFAIIIMTVTFLFSLLFWYLIARKGSNLAKWVLVVLTVVGLLFVPSSMAQMATINQAVTLILTLLNLFAIAFLFRKDARDWLTAGSASKSSKEFTPGVDLK